MPLPLLRVVLPLLTAMLLGGCAGTIRLDNEVRSYPAWDRTVSTGDYLLPAAGDSYQFERRPSQQDPGQAQGQLQLETLAQQALAQHGLHPVLASAPPGVGRPRWTVEVSARSVRLPRAPWEQNYWPGWGPMGSGMFYGARGGWMTGSFGMQFDTPYYQREISLAIRDMDSRRVVYETQAAHDGPWANSPDMWSALLEAALEGFPTPQTGVRRVPLTIPR